MNPTPTALVDLEALGKRVPLAAEDNALGPWMDAMKLVIEEFDVPSDGDELVVPLRVAGKEYPFSVDTGASRSAFDTKLELLLGRPKRHARVQAVSGVVTLSVFDAPPAQLGALADLQLGEVCSHDFAVFRQITGQESYGVLGMAPLRRHVIRLDFDRGKLSLLRAVDEDPGVRIELVYDRLGRPQVQANVTNWGRCASTSIRAASTNIAEASKLGSFDGFSGMAQSGH
jgi:hypothetical protein